jgi:hypothetical protein
VPLSFAHAEYKSLSRPPLRELLRKMKLTFTSLALYTAFNFDNGIDIQRTMPENIKNRLGCARPHFLKLLGGFVLVFLLFSNLSINFNLLIASQNFVTTQFGGSVANRTKEVVDQILLPKEPDQKVEKRLMERIQGKVKLAEIAPLVNCSATSQVRIMQYSDNSIELVSLNKKGKNKTVGGDEYLVTYTDASSKRTVLGAFVHDNG